MARTLVELDETLLADVMRISGASTKRAAITQALEDVRRREQARLFPDFLAAHSDLADPEVRSAARR